MQNYNDIEKILIESKNRLSMTNVDSVDSYTDREIKLSVNGNKVVIKGEKLKIESFNKNVGSFVAQGTVFEINLSNKKQSFFSRLVK